MNADEFGGTATGDSENLQLQWPEITVWARDVATQEGVPDQRVRDCSSSSHVRDSKTSSKREDFGGGPTCSCLVMHSRTRASMEAASSSDSPGASQPRCSRSVRMRRSGSFLDFQTSV